MLLAVTAAAPLIILWALVEDSALGGAHPTGEWCSSFGLGALEEPAWMMAGRRQRSIAGVVIGRGPGRRLGEVGEAVDPSSVTGEQLELFDATNGSSR
jgi:hypothetical protein